MKSPFVCNIGPCRKIFASKYSLKRHRITHDDVKRHPCPVCRKPFALPQYLKEHMVVHSKERPFVCPFAGCSKTFRQAGKLSMHKRLHCEGLAGQESERNLESFSQASIAAEPELKPTFLLSRPGPSSTDASEPGSPDALAAFDQLPESIANFKFPEYFETRILPPVSMVASDLRHYEAMGTAMGMQFDFCPPMQPLGVAAYIF